MEYHKPVFDQLSVDWHWHIIEGVAQLTGDTAWSLRNGAKIPEHFHKEGRSVDGTTEYLDQLQKEFPEKISIYRKPLGEFWNGKLEMVNAPLDHIEDQDALLWQIDSDELWTVENIQKVHRLFFENPHKSGAFYWCWFYVTPDKVVSTRHCYGANPSFEWLRTWRIQPGDRWKAHEPPSLERSVIPGVMKINVADIDPFTQDEMESYGVTFEHHAYTRPEQLEFKQDYYGYSDALASWAELKKTNKPVLLGDYFKWVTAPTVVDDASRMGVPQTGFQASDEPVSQSQPKAPKPHIVIDGAFFQINPRSGIARFWKSILSEWVKNGFADHVTFLARDNTTPFMEGIHFYPVRWRKYQTIGMDSEYLQELCDQLGADLFASTYYTTPTRTPSVFIGHDMIPEKLGMDLSYHAWQEKDKAIRHARAHVMVSENSARDLEELYPCVGEGKTHVALNGLHEEFYPASDSGVSDFKKRYGIKNPFILIVGQRTGHDGYKNAIKAFDAVLELLPEFKLDIVCVGGSAKMEKLFAPHQKQINVIKDNLSDDDLRCAYTSAHALVYLSRYEGFGLPILEAMACGCPAIACRTSSVPEVGGEAVYYVSETDVEETKKALRDLRSPDVRKKFMDAGFERTQLFSWKHTADVIQGALLSACEGELANSPGVDPHDWEKVRCEQAEAERSEGQVPWRKRGSRFRRVIKRYPYWVRKIVHNYDFVVRKLERFRFPGARKSA